MKLKLQTTFKPFVYSRKNTSKNPIEWNRFLRILYFVSGGESPAAIDSNFVEAISKSVPN